jgi:DNA polymerase
VRPEPDCRLCRLCENRTNIVLPSGNLSSQVVFVGEAPGENEDLSGKPFVGKSGKILNAIMEEEGIDRSAVMITNTVKCRPPNNRDPTKEEMGACRPFLDREMSGRKVIVGLGKSACRDLLGYEGKMADIVNTEMSINVLGKDVLFIPTYHPAACIYSRESRDALRTTMRILRDGYLE